MKKLNIKIFDTIIPIGFNCGTGMVLNNLNLRKMAFPLDWVISNPMFVYTYFTTSFKDYFLKNKNDKKNYLGQEFNYFLKSDNHNTHNTEADKEPNNNNNNTIFENNKIKFERRINRLLNILKSNNKTLFVHMKEYKIKGQDILNKNMINNESLYDDYLNKLDEFINKKYPLLCHNLLIIDFGKEESIIIKNRIITLTLVCNKMDSERTIISDNLKKFLNI